MSLSDVAGSGERRQAKRYPMALPVELENEMGITCNVSTSGVFFETDRPFDVGASIRFSMVLEQVDKDVASRLCCQGKVVRVELYGDQWSVAVKITSFQFNPNQSW